MHGWVLKKTLARFAIEIRQFETELSILVFIMNLSRKTEIKQRKGKFW